ncbi:MAG TPA: DNA methyltransferase [Rhizomicrobium sp.]|nr:DNA methyltransferase [Rhizomicrobium sp.]
MTELYISALDDESPGPSLCLAVAHVPLESVVPDPLNPRKHTREQVRAIARSIQTFGFNAPILVDKAGTIKAGHGRLEAAKLLRLTHIPVIRLEHLSGQQAKAYMLADNKLTDRSSWDEGQLALRLKELQDIAIDFEIEATGFEAPEIDFRIQSLDPPDVASADDEFDVLEGPAISQPGDLWHLGPHRLLCGNALEAASYDALLEGELATAVFTDPPYNVRIDGHAVGKGRETHREFAMASGEMSKAQFEAFLHSVLQVMQPHTQPAAVHFMCMDWRHVAEAMAAVEKSEREMINLCVWAKANGGMGSLYRSAHELVLVFRACGEKHLNNVQLGRFGRNRTNVWNYPGMNSFARRGRARALDLHPTVKPIALVADAILDVTRHSDIVLDPFCGSGTTILAAERTGRRGYGIELDPLYVDLAISRWQRITKAPARHASGASFEEMRHARSVEAEVPQ